MLKPEHTYSSFIFLCMSAVSRAVVVLRLEDAGLREGGDLLQQDGRRDSRFSKRRRVTLAAAPELLLIC